jgi:hypothetical protein
MARLNAMPDGKFPESNIGLYPSFLLSLLADDHALRPFLAAFDG